MALFFGFSKQGEEFNGDNDLDMKGHRVTNLPSPIDDSQPVTKSYADTHYSGGSGVGTQGPKGPKCDEGEQGPPRPKGSRGPMGDKGDTGRTGPHGDQGYNGSKGDRGGKDDPGVNGPKGDTGKQGPNVSKATPVLVDLQEALEQRVIRAIMLHEDLKMIRVFKGHHVLRKILEAEDHKV